MSFKYIDEVGVLYQCEEGLVLMCDSIVKAYLFIEKEAISEYTPISYVDDHLNGFEIEDLSNITFHKFPGTINDFIEGIKKIKPNPDEEGMMIDFFSDLSSY